MGILQSLKWVNCHGTATALLALLLWLGLGAHTLAVNTIRILSDIPREDWPARFQRNLAGIQFIHDNWWFVLPYLVLFFGMLTFVEIRTVPCWAVWCAFAFMSLPIFGYLLACIRVGCTTVTFVGSGSRSVIFDLHVSGKESWHLRNHSARLH